MKLRIVFAMLVLASSCVFAGCHAQVPYVAPQSPEGTPLPFWEIRQSGEQEPVGWILGSYHSGFAAPHLDKVILDVFEQADALATETGVDEAKKAIAMQRYMDKRGFYKNGERLSEHLTAEEFDFIKHKLELADHPKKIQRLDTFRPWIVSYMLATRPDLITSGDEKLPQAAPVDKSEFGIETYFEALAGNKIPIHALESPEQALSAMSSGSQAFHVGMLKGVIQSVQSGDGAAKTQAQIENYYQGETVIGWPGEDESGPEGQAYLEGMVSRRDEQMTQSMIPLLKSGKRLFAVVGVGHLEGENSMVQRLQAEGYVLQRLRASGVKAPIAIPPTSVVADPIFPDVQVSQIKLDWPNPPQMTTIPPKEKSEESPGTYEFVVEGPEGNRLIFHLLTVKNVRTPVGKPATPFYNRILPLLFKDKLKRMTEPRFNVFSYSVSGLPARFIRIESKDRKVLEIILTANDTVFTAHVMMSNKSAQQESNIDKAYAFLESLAVAYSFQPPTDIGGREIGEKQ